MIETDKAREPVTFGLVAVFIFSSIEYALIAAGHQASANTYLAWISGIASGIGLALLVERLSSTMSGTPTWVVIALLGYAIIQPIWGSFEQHPGLMLVLTSLALLLKLILFACVYWMMETGILVFYFRRRYELGALSNGTREIDHDRMLFVGKYPEV